jgi:radical SAM superfamily enzyme YgiQ (UPF0313 family)
MLLVQPRESAEPAYPLAIASLIPLLRRAGWEVRGADLHFDPPREIEQLARTLQPSWIGSPVVSQNAADVRFLLDTLRRCVNARTFVFGPLAALDPERALRETGADIALGSSVEAALAGLFGTDGDSDAAPPPGCVVLRNGLPLRGAPLRASALADLPLPDRTVFPVARYSHAVRAVARPYAAVISSRGCASGCPYCPVGAVRPGFDARPPAQVYEEMRSLADEHGVRSIHFEDDNFLGDRGRVVALCELLRSRPIPVVWELLNGVRPSLVDAELLRIMGGAGCRRIVFSFEHLEPVLSDRSGTELDTARRAVEAARAAEMKIGGYFIVGLPGRALSATLRSLRDAFSLRLDYAKFTPFWFAPGSGYASRRPVLEATCLPEGLTRGLCRAAELGFFAQPAIAASLLRDLSSDPALARVVAGRAWELLKAGGATPQRS